MGRIKDGIKSLGGRLKNVPKGRQGRAFLRILQFFAIMLVLTIFARGVAGVTMPVVSAVVMGQQSISNVGEYSGTVSSTNQQDIKLPVGATVQRVHVSSGSSVKAGDDLVSFDLDAVEEELLRQKNALIGLQQELKALQEGDGLDDSAVKAAQKTRDNAKLAYDAAAGIATDAGTAMTNAQNAYNAASGSNRPSTVDKVRQEMEAVYTNAYTANEAAEAARKTAEDNYEAKNGGATTPPSSSGKTPEEYAELLDYYTAWQEAEETKKNTQAALDEAQINLGRAEEIADERIAALHSALVAAQQAKSAADVEVNTTKETLDAAEAALKEATDTYNEAKGDAALAEQLRQNNIRLKKMEIEDQQKAVDDVTAMIADGGTVKATVDGTVTAITVAQGSVVANTDYVRISTGAEGYMVQFAVEQEKARDLQLGSTVSVKQSGAYWGSEGRITGKSMPDESGNVTVRAQLNSTEWKDGDAVTITAVFSDKMYWNTVPLAAVRPDSEGYYVLVLSEENTILGTQTIARKVTVTVQDKNEQYAAIDGGGNIDYDARIIVSSTKPVNDGDMVRIDEESSR